MIDTIISFYKFGISLKQTPSKWVVVSLFPNQKIPIEMFIFCKWLTRMLNILTEVFIIKSEIFILKIK